MAVCTWAGSRHMKKKPAVAEEHLSSSKVQREVEIAMLKQAFARIGALKAGQKKKVATDALKFVALKARYPDAKFILAFADQAASDSVVGWQRGPGSPRHRAGRRPDSEEAEGKATGDSG